MLTEQQAVEAAEWHMRSWKLFRTKKHTFTAKLFEPGKLYLGFSNTDEERSSDDSYASWKANIYGGVFYLLSISIPQRRRGRGHGGALYKICEKIAADLGCHRIQQTPSGWSMTGKSRRVYLHQRGWLDVPGSSEVFKDLRRE